MKDPRRRFLLCFTIFLVISCSAQERNIKAATSTEMLEREPTLTMGLTPSPSPEPSGTSTPRAIDVEIQFTDRVIRNEVIETQHVGKIVWLDPVGIFAIDKDLVYIFGAMSEYRSILLRSENGGLTWKELDIYEPECVYGCKLTHVLFIANGEGWAVMEEGGELARHAFIFIWHTHDYGNTWEEIYQGEKRDYYYDGILGMEFIDSLHGKMVWITGMPPTGETLIIYNTTDGGRSWEKVYEQYIEMYTDPEVFGAFFPTDKGGFYGNHWRQEYEGEGSGNVDKATGFDGSQWEMEEEHSDDFSETTLVINRWLRRQLISEEECIIYVMPTQFLYAEGLLALP
jgi:hypothetical protein